jgi:hypothetical protein
MLSLEWFASIPEIADKDLPTSKGPYLIVERLIVQPGLFAGDFSLDWYASLHICDEIDTIRGDEFGSDFGLDIRCSRYLKVRMFVNNRASGKDDYELKYCREVFIDPPMRFNTFRYTVRQLSEEDYLMFSVMSMVKIPLVVSNV